MTRKSNQHLAREYCALLTEGAKLALDEKTMIVTKAWRNRSLFSFRPSPQTVNRYVEPLTVIRETITPEMVDATGRRVVERGKAERHADMLERNRAASTAAMERK